MSNINAATAAITEAAELAASTDNKITTFGVTVAPSGYFFIDGVRISQDKAVAIAAQAMTEEAAAAAPRQPKRTGFAWESLNEATQDLFFRLCEDIQTATQDHDLLVAARLGVDVHVPLVDAPRLTSCKKCGLLETISGEVKSHKFLRLTDAGRARFEAGR